MKRVEKLAEEYAGQPADVVWYNRVPLDGRVLAQSAFEAGYRQALEDAERACLMRGVIYRDGDPVNGLYMMTYKDAADTIRALAEEEEPTPPTSP